MKKLLLILNILFAAFTVASQNNIIVSENFENVTQITDVDAQTKAIGKFRAGNYSNGAATWAIGLEQDYPLSGKKSAHINVSNAGTDWWNLQFKVESNLLPENEQFEVVQGKDYIVEFKMQTSIATNTKFYVFDTHDFNYPLQLKGGYEPQIFSIRVNNMEKTAKTANFCIGMGNPSVPTEFWIDDFVVYEVVTTGLNENSSDLLKVWSANKKLYIEAQETCSLTLYNTNGQLVAERIINNGKNEIYVPENIKMIFANIKTKDNKNNIFKVNIK